MKKKFLQQGIEPHSQAWKGRALSTQPHELIKCKRRLHFIDIFIDIIFQKLWSLNLGQTNWADKFWGIRGIFGQTISTILAL